MFKLVCPCGINKTVVGDYDFKNFKIVKTIVGDISFSLKIKTLVDDYGFNYFKKIEKYSW